MKAEAHNIFISYRRADTSGYAGRIYDSLARLFGAGQLFMDVSAIQPGESFAARIERTLDASGAVLVVIGREWMNLLKTRESEGVEEDFVRRELAAALKKEVLIVPVLVENAQMPDAAALPEDLRGLAERNALEVSDSRWEHDISRLADALAQAPGVNRLDRKATGPGWGKRLSAFLGILVLAGLIAVSWKFNARNSAVSDKPAASPAPVVSQRILFHVSDHILLDFLERLTAAIERHDWRMVLTLFQGSNFKDQAGIGIDQPQYIAEGLDLHTVGNSLVDNEERIEFKHLNEITRIELHGMSGPDGEGMLTIRGQIIRKDGSRLKVEIPLRRTETGGYELAPAVG